MPEPTQPKEWHEDEGNTARAVTDSPDEQVGEEVNVDEWGEEVDE